MFLRTAGGQLPAAGVKRVTKRSPWKLRLPHTPLAPLPANNGRTAALHRSVPLAQVLSQPES